MMRRRERKRKRKRKRRQDLKILGGYPAEGTFDLSRLPKGPAPGGEPIPHDQGVGSATSA